MLSQLRAETDREPAARGFSFARPSRPLGLAVPRDAPGEDTTVFQEIAQAHREIYALYEIAQSMGTGLGVSDTMTLIAAKLRNVVPFSACALFLRDVATAVFGCRFATGVDAELLRQVVLRDERSVIGWVGANRRPLVNARPSADFEAAGMLVTTELRSSLVCPLVVQDRLVGALAVYETVAGAFTDDHRRLHAVRRVPPGLPERGDRLGRDGLHDRRVPVHRMRRRRGRAAVQARLPGRLHRAASRLRRDARGAARQVPGAPRLIRGSAPRLTRHRLLWVGLQADATWSLWVGLQADAALGVAERVQSRRRSA